ncbi:MAG: tyrosine-type recombinase/integrase [Flavobacteriales bacterium]|nr:tyrosine-type recombinase/integrase [Flavobacteriales bacterium]
MLKQRFLEHLRYERRCSENTVLGYARDLEQFQNSLGEGVGLHEAGHRDVKRWLMALIAAGTLPRSVNRKLSALRAFYRFARTVDPQVSDPTALIEAPKAGKRLPEFVPASRMDALFQGLAERGDARSIRDRLILEAFYGTGMRLAELIGLELGAVDLQRGTVRVLGKRNKERIIPIGEQLQQAIRDYLTVRVPYRGGEMPEPLLLNDRGGSLSRRSVQRIVTQYLGGVTTQKKRSPHVLRHTFATHMLEQGADLNAVKELLGHADLSATQVYTHNTVEKLRKVHAQAHPRGGGPDKRPENENEP